MSGFRGRGRGGGRGGGSGGPPAKKSRNDDDDNGDGESFEQRLGGMLDEEDELVYGGGQEPQTQMEEAMYTQEERFSRWRRPAPPPLDVDKDDIIFQQIDIDHYIGKHYPGMPGALSGPVPVMRMFGVTKMVLFVTIFLIFFIKGEFLGKVKNSTENIT
jgi:DNA polymerase delta subunit 1